MYEFTHFNLPLVFGIYALCKMWWPLKGPLGSGEGEHDVLLGFLFHMRLLRQKHTMDIWKNSTLGNGDSRQQFV